MSEADVGNDGYYGAAELSERFDSLLDVNLPREVLQVEDKRALDVLLTLLANYDPDYDETLPDDPLEAEAVQRLLQRALSRGAWDAIMHAHGARLDAFTGVSNNVADLSALEILEQLESLWEDYPTFQAYLYGPQPPEGPTGVGKTDFAYKLIEIGARVYPDLAIASNNDTDEFRTIQCWTDLEAWLKDTDGKAAFLLDEAAQVLQFSDMTAGKVVSKLLKLLRKYGGNLILVGHTGRDVPRDVRRQLLVVRKQSKTRATIGVGLSEEHEEIRVAKPVLRLKGIPPTTVEYDTLDQGEFDFDAFEEDRTCSVVIRSGDPRDGQIPGSKCENDADSSGVCASCREIYDDEYLRNFRSG